MKINKQITFVSFDEIFIKIKHGYFYVIWLVFANSHKLKWYHNQEKGETYPNNLTVYSHLYDRKSLPLLLFIMN